MKQIQKLGNWRQLLSRAMGWLHCALIYALFYGTAYRFLEGDSALPGRMWWGLLSILPLAAADMGTQVCGKLVLYLPWSLACCGLAWLLLGHPAAAVPVALVCFFRGKNRLSEEPVESMMDRPSPPLTALALAPFFYSALDGSPLLQKLSLIWAALYLLLCAAYRGIQRLDHYLELNRGMAGLPARRIARTTGLALAGMLVLAAGLLLPALTLEDSYLRIDPSPPERTSAVRLEEITPASGGMEMNMAEALQQEFGEPPKMNPVVQFILGAVLCVIGGGFGVYLLYLVIRNFRGTFVDQRDVVQFLGRDTEDEEEPLPQERVRGPAVWDRSPNAQVRRKYRRAVLRSAKEAPPQWASPQEIETRAGLEDSQLHRLYEKARYSQEGCTSQESRSLKR